MSARHHRRPTESQELLIKAALFDGDDAIKAWRRWQELDSVIDADGDSRRMMPLAYRNLAGLCPGDPDLVTLKSVYRHQWVANQQRLQRAALALRSLEAASIETMVLKGAALAEQHYKDVGARVMSDVDILVRTERGQDAAAALAESGWSQFLDTDLETLLPVIQGTLFVDRAAGAVDLHWHALWSPAVEDDFWDAAQPAEVGGAPTLVECPADQLLHACVHGIWSDGQRIRWIPDAMVVLRSTPEMDWDRLVDRARARALTLPLGEALAYLRGEFRAPVPDSAMRSLGVTQRTVAERAGHRAWMAPQTRLRTGWLVLERYRRHLALPPGPTRSGDFRQYLRSWAEMSWELDAGRRLLPEILRRLLPKGSRFAPERP